MPYLQLSRLLVAMSLWLALFWAVLRWLGLFRVRALKQTVYRAIPLVREHHSQSTFHGHPKSLNNRQNFWWDALGHHFGGDAYIDCFENSSRQVVTQFHKLSTLCLVHSPVYAGGLG